MKFKKFISLTLTMLMMASVIPFSVSATTDWGVGDTLEDALAELSGCGYAVCRVQGTGYAIT